MGTRRKLISSGERSRRLDAVKHAWASVGLEGFKIPPEEKERAMRYVNGEIDLDEYMTSPHVTNPNWE
ncbi:chromosome segregation protein ParM [Dyella dinghuensis]|uniref:Chromosome segregation protein ParM n=1 Tax=Dyella dinghuensis TaxID=1920169 RepID=A0A432LPD0_9GAMM|nr:antitoxin VbhA family protein [Dyella dinghuensis]RUL62038.1 chromosome segregation protein ParM [Dyella dinghuensis]